MKLADSPELWPPVAEGAEGDVATRPKGSTWVLGVALDGALALVRPLPPPQAEQSRAGTLSYSGGFSELLGWTCP